VTGHINVDRQHARTRAERTPDAWLKFGSELAQFCQAMTGRDDILAYVGEGAGGPAPACWVPAIAEVEINLDACFGSHVTPKMAPNLMKRKDLYDHPAGVGAILHECGHAVYTLWPLTVLLDLDRKHKRHGLREIVERLEESRMEKYAAIKWSANRGFLRACAQDIVMADLDMDKLKQADPFAVSCLMLVSLARVDAGVLEDDDVVLIQELCEKMFPNLEDFRDLWIEAQALDNHATAHEQLIPIALRWLDALPKGDDDEGDGDKGGQQGKGGAGAGDGDPDGVTWDDILEALEDMTEAIIVNAADELGEQQQQENAQAAADARNETNKEQQNHKQTAKQVFRKGKDESEPYGTRSRVAKRRPPTSAERAAAVKLGNTLDKVRYRDRVKTKTHSQIPPGKLATKRAVSGSAQRSMGIPVTAEPWTHTVRKSVEDPELRIGIMTDISGSMGGAMEPMAVVSYVLGEAAHRIQARAAQIYFGSAVFPTLRPGQRQEDVVVRTAPDGSHRFDLAFKALDGELQLLESTGARLLVIVSDTSYGAGEKEACELYVRKCVKAGVGVVILPFDNGANVRTHHFPKEVQVMTVTSQQPALRAAEVIGEACKIAIESVGNRA
jgi:hypothetical protein